MSAYLAAARAAWPELAVQDDAFERYVLERTAPGEAPEIRHAGDMLLAYACASGVAGAAEAFHAAFSSVMARVLARRRADNLAEDSLQSVYERLLVASAGATPKIAEYRGTAPLRGFVATVTATTLLMMRRAAGRRRERLVDTDSVPGVAGTTTPELLYLKERSKAGVESAVIQALAQLSERERALLHLHVGERLSIDQLAIMYRVSRATAARWLAAARAALVERVRSDLRTTLCLSEAECDSFMDLAQSQLEISLVRRLV